MGILDPSRPARTDDTFVLLCRVYWSTFKSLCDESVNGLKNHLDLWASRLEAFDSFSRNGSPCSPGFAHPMFGLRVHKRRGVGWSWKPKGLNITFCPPAQISGISRLRKSEAPKRRAAPAWVYCIADSDCSCKGESQTSDTHPTLGH